MVINTTEKVMMGQISFFSKSILSDDKIQVHDEVIGYFEKNNLGKGLVKVEKK